VPPAKRIMEQLNAGRRTKHLTWGKVLALAHAPDQDQENATGPQETDTQTWLTEQQIVFALKLVAMRLNTNALSRERYRDELRKMAGEGIQVEQLSLPSEQQIIRAMARKLRQRDRAFPASVQVSAAEPSKPSSVSVYAQRRKSALASRRRRRTRLARQARRPSART
jgi:hypothetical protein